MKPACIVQPRHAAVTHLCVLWSSGFEPFFWATTHFFTLKKIPWHTTNQKHYTTTIFSLLMTIQSLHLFLFTHRKPVWMQTTLIFQEENSFRFLSKWSHSTIEYQDFFSTPIKWHWRIVPSSHATLVWLRNTAAEFTVSGRAAPVQHQSWRFASAPPASDKPASSHHSNQWATTICSVSRGAAAEEVASDGRRRSAAARR